MSSKKDIITRVYPIRTSKSGWDIPLYCYHVCNQRCSQIYVRDRSDLDITRYILIDNPEYINNECPKTGQLERASIHIESFDMDYPIGGSGPLYEPNTIVIPGTYFRVKIRYPLSAPIDVTVRCPSSRGFTLSTLLYSIKMLYQYIYEEEERTSSPRNYHLKKQCDKCSETESQPIDWLKDITAKADDECSICYNTYSNNESTGGLKCGHYYHTQCILRWLETSTTCPLCRQYVMNCDECNGSGVVYYDYNGVVIPLELRGSILNRNTTDGVFGIFGHDLEDLFIDHMYYNRLEKLLTLCIGS